MQLYDAKYIFFNGALMAQNTSVKTDLTGDDQDVFTTALGFNGVSPAPKMRTIEVDNVVPVTGFDPESVEQKYLDSEEVTMRLQFGGTGKKATVKGFLGPVSVNSGVGQTTTMTFSFRGEPIPFA